METDINQASRELKEMLAELIERSESLITMLVTREGTVLADAGDTETLNTAGVAALVAGMFSATRQVARMVGEDQFSILLHQGEKRHIHITLVGDSAMLIIVFEDYQRIGRVRHEARKTATKAQGVLAANRRRREVSADISSPEVKEYAIGLVDRIFAKQ